MVQTSSPAVPRTVLSSFLVTGAVIADHSAPSQTSPAFAAQTDQFIGGCPTMVVHADPSQCERLVMEDNQKFSGLAPLTRSISEQGERGAASANAWPSQWSIPQLWVANE